MIPHMSTILGVLLVLGAIFGLYIAIDSFPPGKLKRMTFGGNYVETSWGHIILPLIFSAGCLFGATLLF
jgi:hypothetical protein